MTQPYAGQPDNYGVRMLPDDDLFALVVRPNRRLAPRDVYESKAARWLAEWPELTVLPWDG